MKAGCRASWARSADTRGASDQVSTTEHPGNNGHAAPTLKARLSGLPAFGLGISGALASPLVTERECAALIEQTLARGGAIFDTGPSYGAGLGETRLGRLLAGNASAFVMTKAGLLSSGMAKRHRDFSPAAITASVDASLQRLRREKIDLLWLHGPARGEVTGELADTLQALQAAGKVSHFGVAGRTEDIFAALDHPIFEAVMLPLNSAADIENRQWVEPIQSAGRLVFAIEVLKSIRVRKKITRGIVWRAAQQMFYRDKGPLQEEGLSAAEAIAWAYDQGGADIVLTTTTSPIHLAANLDVLAHRQLRAG